VVVVVVASMSVEPGRGPSLQAGLFVGALYCSAPSGSVVEVRFRAGSGMDRRFLEVELLQRLAVTIRSLASRTDVYVGVVPRRRRGGGRTDLVERAGVVWVDCDGSASVVALREFRPMPGMVVSSGSAQNCHAYWFLREPAALEAIERVNRRLALTLGADVRCTDAARILRPAGSVNRKHSPPTTVRLLRLAATERVAVEDLERGLVAEPGQLARNRTGLRLADASERTDRLELIPPRVYFEQLTGLPVGRSGKVRCPFHDDGTPSLHVYEQPGQGWYCFGCGRGGSVFDLGALLWHRETRGRDFWELRRELEVRLSSADRERA
jgi:hypothetical protein